MTQLSPIPQRGVIDSRDIGWTGKAKALWRFCEGLLEDMKQPAPTRRKPKQRTGGGFAGPVRRAPRVNTDRLTDIGGEIMEYGNRFGK